MKIVIKKSEIFSEVEKQTAYIAATVEGGIHFDELWATVHENEILDSYWIEGCTSAVNILMRYIRSESVEHNLEQHSNAEVLEIRADMPDTFNDFLIGSIVSSLKMMLVNSILGSWLSVKYPAVSERYLTLAKDFIEDVRNKLLYRNQPYQNRSEHIGEDTNNESVVEQYSKGQADVNDTPVTEYYGTGAADKADVAVIEQFSAATSDATDAKITEQFSKGQADVNDTPITEYYGTGTTDKDDVAVTEQFSAATSDVADGPVTEYFENLESDNLILKQYEKCCYHP